jgi:hypothetical protein
MRDLLFHEARGVVKKPLKAVSNSCHGVRQIFTSQNVENETYGFPFGSGALQTMPSCTQLVHGGPVCETLHLTLRWWHFAHATADRLRRRALLGLSSFMTGKDKWYSVVRSELTAGRKGHICLMNTVTQAWAKQL